MKNVLLVRMGEIFLKGDNRNFFINALVQQIRKAIDGTGCELELTQGRIYIRNIADMEDTIHRVTRVFGVHSVSPVVECEKNIDVIGEKAVELMQPFSHLQGAGAPRGQALPDGFDADQRGDRPSGDRGQQQSFRGCA